MSYTIKYDIEYKRTIPAVIYDSRFSNPSTKKLDNNFLKLFSDLHVGQVGQNGLPYKIVTDSGNLVGYFVVDTRNKGLISTKTQEVIRPAFQQFITEIDLLINDFVKNGLYRPDMLL